MDWFLPHLKLTRSSNQVISFVAQLTFKMIGTACASVLVVTEE